MSMTGPKPKAAQETVSRNRPAHEWSEVENVPFQDGPDLRDLRDNTPWPQRTCQATNPTRSPVVRL
jgi:hypothetical protein